LQPTFSASNAQPLPAGAQLRSIPAIQPSSREALPSRSAGGTGPSADQMLAALRDIGRPLYAIQDGRGAVLTDRVPHTLDGLAGVIPAVAIENLGSHAFRKAHNLRYAYVAGAMAGGIASVDLVVDMAQAGCLGFFSVSRLKHKLGYDDSLDAFGVHGMCGALGALATGLFADPAVNAAGTGLFFGNPKQLLVQIISILATAAFTAIGTLILVYVTKALTGGLRVGEENEIMGLDGTVHGERAFELE